MVNGCGRLCFVDMVIVCAAVDGLGIEGVERSIGSKLKITYPTIGNIVGDPIIIRVFLGLIKILLLII